ncbi:phosphoenolpyruvate--protein phosphotransferase [Spiroplasma turonicum]|uniref:Phosphoenolpyruvate-protein phosphotransferase n=1 Tax=Spiroplasma turonicum TaxID=216946 RepID=A0A0K1P4X6_9MOLU|nr:phosphoenolpyruvate--protein phosphotransferase [Spiroplasma turonicum]AKU79348.1 phosphoenolpyruvate-protein phosphotransferase [Spiroplasma turonicum]ALX70369.1 phosphoenolpyruvate-protein phosphotransferase [Spiroplasma turonicum]
MSNKYSGIGASNGIALAKVYILKEEPIVINDSPVKDIDSEINIINESIVKAKKDLFDLKNIALEKLGEEKAAIFEAHASILEDPEMANEFVSLIKEKNCSASKSISQVAEKYIALFKGMEDAYFQERAADIKDVTERLLRYVLNLPVLDLATISEEVIIVAEDLTPSQTAQLNPLFVKGFACNVGGRTSHAAIMARSLEIPAVLGLKNILTNVKLNDLIAINGSNGEVEVNPKDKKVWEDLANKFKQEQEELKKMKEQPTITKDGYDKFILEANIGSPKDVASVLDNGGEGIGLFRSEFLYMDNDHFPTEEEQFQAYKEVVEKMNGKLVVIRTLDIGGDKKLSYFKFPEEMNPFLGYRAIRFTLDRKDIFKDQIRALLRASAYGHIGIMFPMIATVDEFLAAKNFTLDCKKELEKEGHKVGSDLEIGMMVEIPAAAVNAENFAKYADFFSIGTNDLIQYTMAADRMSENVSYLYQPFNPSILKLLKMTIDGGHKHNRWVGMCGEMAGEPDAIPLLMGLGLDAYSMSATSILKARSIMSKLTLNETQSLAKKALECENTSQVLELVNQLMQNK